MLHGLAHAAASLSAYTRGDQKLLQLGYKRLTYYIIHTLIFRHILLQHQCIFSSTSQLFMPWKLIFRFDSHSTAITRDSSSVNHHKDGTSDFLLGNNHWEPSLDCIGRMVRLNKFTVAESLLSNQWLERWCIVMKKSKSWVTTFVSVSASWHRVTWVLVLHNTDQ